MAVVEAQGDSGSRIHFFSFLERLVAQVRPQIFFSRTLERLGRTLEPYYSFNVNTMCIFVLIFFNNKDKIMTTIFIFAHFGLNICHTFIYLKKCCYL